jgi:hypothetical protein
MGTAQIVAGPCTLSGGEVEQLDPYAFFAVLGKRVIHNGLVDAAGRARRAVPRLHPRQRHPAVTFAEA